MGVTASVIAHVFVMAWSSRLSFSTDGALGSRATRVLAATDPMHLVRVTLPVVPEAEPSASAAPSENARPIPTVEPPKLTVREVAIAGIADEPMIGEPLEVPPGMGSATVAGTGDGTGAGEGTDGEPDTYIPPRARDILHGWRPPPSVLGTEVLVRVHVDAAGRATGPIEIIPETRDDETNREIMYRAGNIEYWPARVNGDAVAAWAEITIEFCYEGTKAASPPSPGFQVGEPCTDEGEADGSGDPVAAGTM